MEIYNEKCRDLLDVESSVAPRSTNPTTSTNLFPQSNLNNLPKSNTLKIREHPTKGIFVQNLNQYNVTDLKSTMRHLLKGNQNRLTR